MATLFWLLVVFVIYGVPLFGAMSIAATEETRRTPIGLTLILLQLAMPFCAWATPNTKLWLAATFLLTGIGLGVVSVLWCLRFYRARIRSSG